MSEGARNKARMAVYSMAGFYLVYLAYNMFRDLNTTTGNDRVLMIVFMIFFAVVGVGMMVMGIVKGYQLSKRNMPPKSDDQEEDEHSDS